MRASNRLLLGINLVMLLLLGFLIGSSDRFKTWANLTPPPGPHPSSIDFRSNPFYEPQLAFLRQQPDAQIVMLGTSLSAGADWKDLLRRCDVVNQGIHSDVTPGMLARIHFVTNRHPAICFIETGTNDISYDIPEATTLSKLRQIVALLQHQNVIPVLHTVTKMTPSHPDTGFNKAANALNQKLRRWSQEGNLQLIDLDAATDSAGFFKTTFAAADGAHYSYNMYQYWASEILKTLRRNRL